MAIPNRSGKESNPTRDASPDAGGLTGELEAALARDLAVLATALRRRRPAAASAAIPPAVALRSVSLPPAAMLTVSDAGETGPEPEDDEPAEGSVGINANSGKPDTDSAQPDIDSGRLDTGARGSAQAVPSPFAPGSIAPPRPVPHHPGDRVSRDTAPPRSPFAPARPASPPVARPPVDEPPAPASRWSADDLLSRDDRAELSEPDPDVRRLALPPLPDRRSRPATWAIPALAGSIALFAGGFVAFQSVAGSDRSAALAVHRLEMADLMGAAAVSPAQKPLVLAEADPPTTGSIALPLADPPTAADPVASDAAPADPSPPATAGTDTASGLRQSLTADSPPASDPPPAAAADPAPAVDPPAKVAAADPAPPADPPRVAAADPLADPPAKKTPVRKVGAGPAKIVKDVNLRAGPDNSAAAVMVLAAGTRVTIVECKVWCEVQANGKQGFIFPRFLTPVSASSG